MPSIEIQGIGHPSKRSVRQTKRPGTRRRVVFHALSDQRCCLASYVCVPINNSVCTPKSTSPGHSVEMTGFEPVTFALQRRCSPAELHPQVVLGSVGLTGFEPVTPVLSGLCSNQLSYKPRVRTLTTEK